MSSFGSRLHHAMGKRGPLCVGIDPHPGLLQAWGLPDTPEGVRIFSTTVTQALAGQVAAVKPQAAFYERHGHQGMKILEEVIDQCQKSDLLCIVDAKRGDIGSTMDGYADAYLTEGSAFAGDAVTLSPFLGVGSLRASVERALENDRGVFILALTSNPDGPDVQHSTNDAGVSVAAQVARFAQSFNATTTDPLGSVGLVVGATIGSAASKLGINLEDVNGPLLAPGIGAQGGKVTDLPVTFGKAVKNVVVSSSREILSAGPEILDLQNAAVSLSTTLGLVKH